MAERNIFLKREGKNMYEDKTLVCKDCGKEFVFTFTKEILTLITG